MDKVEERVIKTAIFIDLPNLAISAEGFGYKVNTTFFKLLDLTKQYGKIVEGFAYGDFERLRLDLCVQRALISQNITLIHCPPTPNGENKIDDPMFVEGIHSSLRKNLNVFYILVTGDVMVLPVTMTLQSLGKNFKIFGFLDSTSSSLRRLPEFIALDRYLKKENTHFPVKEKEVYEKVAC